MFLPYYKTAQGRDKYCRYKIPSPYPMHSQINPEYFIKTHTRKVRTFQLNTNIELPNFLQIQNH
jgi:hypothetical protein